MDVEIADGMMDELVVMGVVSEMVGSSIILVWGLAVIPLQDPRPGAFLMAFYRDDLRELMFGIVYTVRVYVVVVSQRSNNNFTIEYQGYQARTKACVCICVFSTHDNGDLKLLIRIFTDFSRLAGQQYNMDINNILVTIHDPDTFCMWTLALHRHRRTASLILI